MSDLPQDKSLFSLAQIQHLMRVEFNRAQRYGYPIACLMISIDRLGHLRDVHGYEAKEEILGAVVDLLRGATRGSDFLGRLADDRLLAVVPHTNAEGLQVMAGRLLRGAEELRFEGDGKMISIGLSLGGSLQEPGAGSPFFDALLQSAEEALEEATSEGGRQLVMLAPGATFDDAAGA